MTKRYRVLKLLSLSPRALSKPEIALIIGQKSLPSFKRQFTGMATFMGEQERGKLIRRSRKLTPTGAPLWLVTLKGRAWVLEVEAKDLEKHVKSCRCGQHPNR